MVVKNKLDLNIKEIDIFIRVDQIPPSNRGKSIIIHRYKGKTKELFVSILERTQNRSILHASALALLKLKEPCNINLYLQTNVGIKFLDKPDKKWVNRDMGNLLIDAASKGGHLLNIIDCSQTKEGKDKQNLLAMRLKAVFK